MAAGGITTTTAAIFRPTVWAGESLRALQSKLGLADRVTRKYETNLTHGQTIVVPIVSNLTTASKTGNATVAFEVFTESSVNIAIDQWEYVAFRIDDMVNVQSAFDLRSEYSFTGGYAMKRKVDVDIAGIFDGFSANTVGTLASPLQDSDRLTALQLLLDSDVDCDNPDNLTWALSPKEFATNWLQDERISNQFYGGGNSVLKDARLGQVYNAVVFQSTVLEGDNTNGHDNALFHREAIALVMQKSPRWDAWRNVAFIADEVVCDMVYGFKEMRDVAGVWAKGY